MKNSYLLKNGHVIDVDRKIDCIMDLGVANGVIVDVKDLKNPTVIDCTNKYISVGFIDVHVHLRQPGNNAAETVKTGSRAAAAGGFTAIVPMPNTNPAADTPGAIEYLRQLAAKDSIIKILPCGCMTKGYQGKEMAPIAGLKQAGIFALSDDGRCVQDHKLMRNIIKYAKSFDLPILDHCEEESLFVGGVMNEGRWSDLLGMTGIPSLSEELIVARDIMFAREADWRVHLQHISSKECVKMVRRARREGVKVTAEVTPHHISLTDKVIKTYDTNYKMNPPLRTESDRLALIEALADGTVTVIATDHAPHTTTAKMVEFNSAPFGIIGLETAIPICLEELVHTNILTMSQFVSKFTVGPAEVLGLKNYNLAVGNAADITIIDINDEYVIDAEKFATQSRNTPFNGKKVKGRAVATMVDGEFVYSIL